MGKRGKKYQAKKNTLENRLYSAEEAIQKIKDFSYTKFDSTVEVHINLGLSQEKFQPLRGSYKPPHFLGKEKKILVFAEGEKAKEAKEAGADFVGGEELVKKIQGGFLDFDVALATPDLIPKITKIAKIIGPKGLMPNPKNNTITQDLTKAVQKHKEGLWEIKSEAKVPIIHSVIGKTSFPKENLLENLQVLLKEVKKLKPPKAKGRFLKKIFLTSTMSPSILVDPESF